MVQLHSFVYVYALLAFLPTYSQGLNSSMAIIAPENKIKEEEEKKISGKMKKNNK